MNSFTYIDKYQTHAHTYTQINDVTYYISMSSKRFKNIYKTKAYFPISNIKFYTLKPRGIPELKSFTEF